MISTSVVIHGVLLRKNIAVELRAIVDSYLYITLDDETFPDAFYLLFQNRPLATLKYGPLPFLETSKVTGLNRL